MAETVYEGMFILDPNRYGRDPEKVVGVIPRMVEEAGGEMLVSRLWDERRLAYPIKGHTKGTYWLTYFRMDSSRIHQVRRQCEINENFLRVLFLKVDPRIADALVAHARVGTSMRDAAAQEAAQQAAEKPEKDDSTADTADEQPAGADTAGEAGKEKS